MKRATLSRLYRNNAEWYFNPRPREEGDGRFLSMYGIDTDFNPRPREEGDLTMLCQPMYIIKISIHALVKRATEENEEINNDYQISIHALVKRATSSIAVSQP